MLECYLRWKCFGQLSQKQKVKRCEGMREKRIESWRIGANSGSWQERGARSTRKLKVVRPLEAKKTVSESLGVTIHFPPLNFCPLRPHRPPR